MAFTAQQLFTRTIGMLGISVSNASTYTASFIEQVNTVLNECFKIENTNRAFKVPAITELTAVPSVTALADSIDYQEDLFQVLAYGLAMYLSMSDDDIVKTQFFNVQYNEAQSRARKMVPSEITDYFSAEDTALVE